MQSARVFPTTSPGRDLFRRSPAAVVALLSLLICALVWCRDVRAQVPAPTVVDGSLAVRSVVTGLTQPTMMAFLGPGDILVLEKSTGRVQRVTGGVIQGAVLDLPVNSGSERGLLGIALHPDFATNNYAYLFWTESPTGADSNNLADLGSLWFGTEPLRTNRVDRFVWNGSSLTFDANVIRLRSYQADAGQPLRGNHNGGVIQFGLDGKLYVVIGDNGRRGWMQNLEFGSPAGALTPYAPFDDQFGGPEPDDNHLAGVILRLNDDGSAPADNPFFVYGAAAGGEVGANLQKVYVYGVRNSFGLAVDPRSGFLWDSQNGDDGFGEINRYVAGANAGWVQVMGPLSRVAEYKAIETSTQFNGIQQIRWPTTLIADTPADAAARLFALPGSTYVDPQLSWKYDVSPTGMGFHEGDALGAQYNGDLFVGGAIPTLAGGYLFRLEVSGDRLNLAVEDQDSRLADRVADNNFKYDVVESESLLFGSNFGGVTDIRTGPNGNLYVVSVTRGAIYEILPAN